MARVFVSHAGQDRDLSGEVFGWLVDDGHELFFDQDLRAGLAIGEPWEPRLFERLRWADAVVCLVTSAYVTSVWCTAELTTAVNRGSRVLPVLAEDGISHPLLIGIQHSDYARYPGATKAALGEALRRVDAAGGQGWADQRSPFPGLRPFDTDMHRVFFGRRREVQKMAELLRSPVEQADRTMLVVTGSSGCGKSSLVRAGLLPVMADEPEWWTLPAVLPGTDLIGALAREITSEARRLGLTWELPAIRTRLLSDPSDLIEEVLLATPPGPGRPRRLLIVIDQLEELLTRTSSSDLASAASVLRAVTNGPAQVVATLRPEFLAPLLANPDLTGVVIHTFALRPLPPEALPEVIRGPAELAGIGVDPELINRLVADTKTGEALPLLAFTLQQLAADVPRNGRLSISHYELLGGVQGALISQADSALAAARAATSRTTEQVIAGLLGLVTVDEQGRPIRTRVPLDDLPRVVHAELDAFTARRLLTTDTENETVVIGVAHEAFLSTWPPLTRAITSHGAALRARRAVERAAAEWDTTGRHRNRLWERGQLAAALNDLGDPALRRIGGQNAAPQPIDAAPSALRRLPRRRRLGGTKVDLGPRARDFLLASIRTDRRRRARATTILSLLLVGALAAVAVVYSAERNAQEQQRVSLARQLGATSVSEAATNLDVANLLAVQAYRTDSNPQTRSALFRAVTASGAMVGYLPFGGHVSDLEGSGDGRVVVVGLGDGRVLRWAVDTPAPELLATLPGEVTGLAVNRDGTVVAAVGGNEAVVRQNGGEPRRFETTNGQAPDLVAVTPAGSTVIVHRAKSRWTGPKSIDVYDVATGTVKLESLTPHPDMAESGPSTMIATSEDEVLLFDSAYGSWDRRRISDWSLIDGSTAGFGAHNYAAGVSSSGQWFTETNADSTIPVWTTSGPTEYGHPSLTAQAPLTDPGSLTLSPNGSRAAIADSGVIYVAPVAPPGASRETAVQLTGAGNPNINGVRFLGDNDHLISAVGDAVVVWNLNQPDRITTRIDAPIQPSCNACFPAITVSPDGARAAIEVQSGFGKSFVVPVGDPTDAGSLTYIPNGTQTAVWTSDGSQVVVPSNTSSGATEPNGALPAIARTVPVPDGGAGVVAAGRATDGRSVILVDQRGRVDLVGIQTGGLLNTVVADPPGKAGGSGRYDAAINSAADQVALLDTSDVPGHPLTITDVHTGATLGTITGDDLGAVAYAGHRLLAQRKNGTLEVWDERGTAIERVISGDSSYYLPPVGSEYGSLIARQRTNSTIDLVDLATGSVMVTFPPSDRLNRKTAIGFNADGTKLITATEGTDPENGPKSSGFLEIRDVSDETLIRTACATAGRDLTSQEWQALVVAAVPDNLACH